MRKVKKTIGILLSTLSYMHLRCMWLVMVQWLAD